MVKGQGNKVKLEFLRDDPISKSESDEFKHTSIANTLETIINDASSSITIGLFANWGVGKSGVSTLIKSSLLKKKKIACIEFDVWKYEDEVSLRRQFIHTLDKQLSDQGMRGESKLNELLSASVTKEVDDGIGIDKAELFKLIILCFIVIAAAVISSDRVLFGVATLVVLVGIIGFDTILKTGLKIFRNNRKTVTESRLTASDEFEQEFHAIVDLSTADKIVVILDNLDRATEEKAVILLSTVKSFLEYGKCIYLVPCDEAAIKKHLKNTYNYLDGNAENTADEFLRKFFNTYIRIPSFIDADLQVYTEKHLKQTKFGELYPSIENLGTVITSAYRENPRQIKQFINIFLAHYLLASERESDGDMPPGEVTGNPEFLAKILIIQQRWPKQYEQVLKGKALSEAAEVDKDGVVMLPDDYKIFLTGSSLTEEPENIKSFLYYKRSQREASLPPGTADSLRTATEDAKLEEVKSQVTKIKESKKDQSRHLNDFFREILEDAERGSRRQVIINIINSLNIVWLENMFQLDDLLLQRINKAVRYSLRSEDLFATDEHFISHSLAAESTQSTKDIVALKYLDAIEPAMQPKTENVIKVLNFVEKNEKLYASTKAKQRLSTNLINFAVDFQVMQKITASKEILSLAQASLVNEVAAKITQTDIEISDGNETFYDLKTRLLRLSPRTDTDIMNQYLESMREMINQVIRSPENSEYLTKLIPVFLDFIYEKKSLIIQNDFSKNIIDKLIDGYRTVTIFEIRSMLLKPLLILRDVADNEQKTNIQSYLNTQIASTVESAEDFLSDPHFDSLYDDVKAPLEDAAVNSGPMINIIWKYGDDESKVSLVDRLFSVSPNTALAFLEERINVNDLPNDLDRLSIAILGNAERASITEKMRYYDCLNKLSQNFSSQTRDEILSHIAQLAKQAEPLHQEIAESLYHLFKNRFTKPMLKELGMNILNWLSTQGRVNSSFLPSLRIVQDNNKSLNRGDSNKLLQVILDKWVLQETNEAQISRSKDLVLDIPNGLREKYVEDINNRIESYPYLADALSSLIDKIESDSKNSSKKS